VGGSDASDDATSPAHIGVRFGRCDGCCGNFEMLKYSDAEKLRNYCLRGR
jgi:hypothetical protein